MIDKVDVKKRLDIIDRRIKDAQSIINLLKEIKYEQAKCSPSDSKDSSTVR